MEMSIQTRGSVDVVSVVGRIDSGAHMQLRNGLRNVLEAGRREFVLDLRETTMLDSMAIGELVACLKRARERGGDVRLVVSPDGMVHEMIQITKLDQAFQIFGDSNEARMSFVMGPN
jgi:anti-sigma B factor antagonist